jgi:hypothetical protein
MRTWQFVFRGDTTGNLRSIADRSNSRLASEADVQRVLDGRYGESHTMQGWVMIEDQSKD